MKKDITLQNPVKCAITDKCDMFIRFTARLLTQFGYIVPNATFN